MARSQDDGYGVLIIYTGGTIGSIPKDKDDPMSPLVPADLDEVMRYLPRYNERDKKIAIGQNWVRLGTYSWKEPLDSSNITPDDWVSMAEVIKDNYAEYEGFVVLHGTDTLSYTASVLSFMLDNLNKPVIITGSQKPIGETRSDAVQNLVTSIEIAAAHSLGATVVPEVLVCFRDCLYRGCRITKVSASKYMGFDSPNLPLLGEANEHIVINEKLISKGSSYNLTVFKDLERNIASMDIFPGMNVKLLKNMLSTEDLKGVVLQTFGTGNAPTTDEFLTAIGEAVDSGKLILDVTQCRSGEVELGLYDVSAGLLSRGVVSGMDMTPETALTKMAYVLGREENLDEAADLIQLNLRGEQRQSIFNLHFPAGEVGEDESAVLEQSREMYLGLSKYDPKMLDKAILRIMGLHLLEGGRGRIDFKVYIDLPDATENTSEEGNRNFLGYGSKRMRVEKESVFLTVTEQVLDFVDNNHVNKITIVNTGGVPFAWEKLNIAFFTDS